jgi:putative heme-binding domain-containing protein
MMMINSRENRGSFLSGCGPAATGWNGQGTALVLVTLMVIGCGGYLGAADKAAPRKFYLPKSPRAAAYVLGRLSNQELTAAPRSEYVYVALLERAGLDRKYRIESLDGLTQLRGTDTLTELTGGLKDLDEKGEEAAPVIRELGGMLLQAKPAALAEKRKTLVHLAGEVRLGVTRQFLLAGVMTGDGTVETVWREMEGDDQKVPAVLGAVPLLREARLREGLFSRIEPFLGRTDAPEILRAAIPALAAVPGREADAFDHLSALVKAGTERAVAVAGLQRLPKKLWPREEAGPLAESLVAYLKTVPAGDRTGDDYLNLMQFTSDLASLLPSDQGRALEQTLSGLGVRVIVIRTIYEQMLFDKRKFVVEAGRPVQVVLENPDAMQHNLVIVRPGAMEEIGKMAEKMPPVPDAEGRLHVPDSPQVLWATKLLSTGEKAKLSFEAPAQPGEYPYLCTYPGHWLRMNGFMVVVPNLADYLASHPVSAEPVMTEWKIEDFAEDLNGLKEGRSLAAGRALFTALACVQCHKLGGQGYAFGPDLTEVFKRYNQDPGNVLREILQPSKTIQDPYRNYQFELKDGESVNGMIVKEDATSVTIHSGPADALVQTIVKEEIKSRQPQPTSFMPAGLLNMSSKEQILDLLAFLEGGGVVPGHGAHGP